MSDLIGIAAIAAVLVCVIAAIIRYDKPDQW